MAAATFHTNSTVSSVQSVQTSRFTRRRRLLPSSSSSAARCCHQYDPLSYSRNFDFGTALDGNEACSFASRFVLAASAARQPQ